MSQWFIALSVCEIDSQIDGSTLEAPPTREGRPGRSQDVVGDSLYFVLLLMVSSNGKIPQAQLRGCLEGQLKESDWLLRQMVLIGKLVMPAWRYYIDYENAVGCTMGKRRGCKGSNACVTDRVSDECT
jgi:hypothetical protein